MASATRSSGERLTDKRVLIVEDEAFIALDLTWAVEDEGGEVVGPATTVREALKIVDDDGIEAAILDVNLPDGHIGPVLEALVKRGVPVVVHTGVGLPPDVRSRHPDVPVYSKPTPAPVLAKRLSEDLAG